MYMCPCIIDEGLGVSHTPDLNGQFQKIVPGVEPICIYHLCKVFPSTRYNHAQPICVSAGLIIFTTVINVILILRLYALYKSSNRGGSCPINLRRSERSISSVLCFLIFAVFGAFAT